MKLVLTLCLGLAASLAGAQTLPDASPSLAKPLGPEVPFTDQVFTLISVEGQPAPYRADLHLAEGKITGQAPCNRFFGTLTYDATRFRIENIGATRMACPDLDHETAFFALLDKTRQIDRREGQITLLDDAGSPLLYFTTAQP